MQLQTSNPSNFFYRDELIQEDVNVGINDFIQPKTRLGKGVAITEEISILDDALGSILHIETKNPLRNYWKSHQFTHGNKKELDVINIINENVIYGCFKDVIGRIEKQHISYIIQVYLWFEGS